MNASAQNDPSSHQRVFAMRPHIFLSITSLASASIVTDRSSLPEGAWMPQELGRFHIPHAGFIEAYDNEEGKKDVGGREGGNPREERRRLGG